jgi:hypothetical protein
MQWQECHMQAQCIRAPPHPPFDLDSTPEIETEERTMKNYFIRIGNESVPVSKQIFKEYSRMGRREVYLYEADKKKGIVLDRMLSEEGFPSGARLFESFPSVEDIAISRIMLSEVYKVIKRLQEQDRLIIHLLYQLDKNECEAAKIVGIGRCALREKRDRIIRTLRRQIGSL